MTTYAVGNPSILPKGRDQEPVNPRRYNILSIDGGGIRGIIPAKILHEIEYLTQKPTHQLFNLIGGTSTGGMLALGLTGSLTQPEGSE